MKSRDDLVQGWVRKAESDLTNARLCVQAGQALDTACFHAQQAAERYLKAYLTTHDVEFPYIHNLEKLIALCEKLDPAFGTLSPLGQELTPYAVELRYDDEFWPSPEAAARALNLSKGAAPARPSSTTARRTSPSRPTSSPTTRRSQTPSSSPSAASPAR